MRINVFAIQKWLFYVIFAFSPLNIWLSIELFGKFISPTKICLLVSFVMMTIKLIANGFRAEFPKEFRHPFLLMGLVLVFDVVATYRGINSFGMAEIVETVFCFYLLYLSIYLLKRDIRIFFTGLKVLAAVVSTGVLLQLYIVVFDKQPFIKTGVWKEFVGFIKLPFRGTIFPMPYGLNGILILSVMSFCLVSIWHRGCLFKRRWFAGVVSILLIWALFISNSRSTWLGMFLLLFVLGSYFLLSLKSKVVSIAFIVILLVGFGLLFKFLYTTVQSEHVILSGVTEMRQKSITVRVQQYSIALDLIYNNPLWGLGHGVFKNTTELRNIYLHNYFLRRVTDIGILGGFFMLLLMILPGFGFFKLIFLQDRREIGLFFACMLASYAGMLVEMSLYDASREIYIVWIFIIIYFIRYPVMEQIAKNASNSANPEVKRK